MPAPKDAIGEEEVDREDELPTVVVLRKGDVGQEEFLETRRKMKGSTCATFLTSKRGQPSL